MSSKIVETTLEKPKVGHQIKDKIKKEFPFAIGTPAFIWQVLFFYLPLFFIIISSVVEVSYEGHFGGLTFENFRQILKPTYFHILGASLSLAFVTTLICLVIAFPLAYFLAFRGGKYRTLLLFFLVIPFWTNFLLHVYAWFFVLERDGFLNNFLISMGVIESPIHFLNSFFAIILMMTYYYLPFMVLPIYSALEKFNKSLIEASFDLGASWRQTFKNVVLPLVMPAVRVGVFLVFIPSFGEFVIPELMGGDKKFFVGSVVSQYMLGDQTAPMGAAFTVLSCFVLIVASLLLIWLINKFRDSLVRSHK